MKRSGMDKKKEASASNKRMPLSERIQQDDVILAVRPEDAESTADICERTGWGESRVRRALKQYQKQGKLRSTQTLILDLRGQRNHTTLYWIEE